MMTKVKVYELNLDGLVGPTHHYAGLAYGNIASMTHAHTLSNPAEAALQGLQKIRLMHELGLKQAILPPQLRPNLKFLHQLGFTGPVATQLAKAKKHHPRALSAAFSASSMWAANAATVAPSTDTNDQKVHFTTANLVNHLHRHQEADASHALFCQIFKNQNYFIHHACLPKTTCYNDEGAANHNRLACTHGAKGLHIFVYGQSSASAPHASSHPPVPLQFPARQTQAASEAVARLHTLEPERTAFIAQNPMAINAGVFHNDVIALANESLFLIHQDAFLDQSNTLEMLKKQADFDLNIIEISRKSLTLEEAIQSYFFNAQLVSLPNTSNMAFIAPIECQTSSRVRALIEQIIADTNNPITTVHYVSLKQSMQNGGGPACLRLRVPLSEKEYHAMHQGVLVTSDLLNTLEALITKHYRSKLSLDDLTDPMLVDEAFAVHDAITQALRLI